MIICRYGKKFVSLSLQSDARTLRAAAQRRPSKLGSAFTLHRSCTAASFDGAGRKPTKTHKTYFNIMAVEKKKIGFFFVFRSIYTIFAVKRRR